MADDRDANGDALGDARPGRLRTDAVPRPSSGAAPFVPAFAAVFGLGVAALSLNAAGSAPFAGDGPLNGDWLPVALAVAVGGAIAAAKYRARQDERPMGTAREARAVTATFACLLVATLATFVAVIALGTGHAKGPDNPPSPVVRTAPVGPTAPVPPPVRSPAAKVPPLVLPIGQVFQVLLGLLILALLAATVVAVLRRLRARTAPVPLVASSPGPDDGSEALSEAVRSGRLALRGEDVRAAVIACYAAMEESLAVGGVGRQAADSPADLLRRATGAGLLAGAEPSVLTDLFREARYSTHPMDEEQLRRARAALDAISAHLAERRTRLERERELRREQEDEAERSAAARPTGVVTP